MFKECPLCGHQWSQLRDFVEDRNLLLNGYQPSFSVPDEGFLLFTHITADCGTTLSIGVVDLKPLYRGVHHEECMQDHIACPNNCFDPVNFVRCDQPCSLAWIREVMQVFRSHEYIE